MTVNTIHHEDLLYYFYVGNGNYTNVRLLSFSTLLLIQTSLR